MEGEGAVPKRESIIEAATHIFAEKGFHPAGMREIAAQAKVAIGTIYHYFKSKEDILIQIFREEIELLRRFFEELRTSGLSIREQIQRILAMHFERIKENKQLVKLILVERLAQKERGVAVEELLKGAEEQEKRLTERIRKIDVLHKLLKRYRPKPINGEAAAALTDLTYLKGLLAYGRACAAVLNPVMEGGVSP